VDARALLFKTNFEPKLARLAVELGDHGFDLDNLAPLLVDLKLFEPNKGLERLHWLLLRSRAGIRPLAELNRQPWSRAAPPLDNIVAR
jgi:hypothetical protein